MFGGLRRGQVQFHAGCVGITKIDACAGALAHFFHDQEPRPAKLKGQLRPLKGAPGPASGPGAEVLEAGGAGRGESGLSAVLWCSWEAKASLF